MVKKNSMEPTIMEGDFIIMEECDPANLQVGDVIAFFATEQDKVIVKTHRIVTIDSSSGANSYITRGDNNQVDDPIPVFPTDIIGKWHNVRLAKVGTVLDFVSSQTGFLICIVVPLFILFVYQIYKFVVVVIEEKNAANAKNEEAILAAAERIKAKKEQQVQEKSKQDEEKEVAEPKEKTDKKSEK